HRSGNPVGHPVNERLARWGVRIVDDQRELADVLARRLPLKGRGHVFTFARVTHREALVGIECGTGHLDHDRPPMPVYRLCQSATDVTMTTPRCWLMQLRNGKSSIWSI